MSEFDLVVVGAGASGLTAAITARRSGRRVTVVEAGERVGGCVHSWRPTADFWLELGAHTAYNSYGAMLDLQRDRGFADLVARAKVGYHFFADGRLVSPFAHLGLFEAIRHLPGGLRRDKRGADVQGYFSDLLGPRNWERLLAPAFAAVLSQPAGPYPAEWLFKRKPREPAAPRKFTHAAGLQGWLERLVADNQVQVQFGQPVVAVMPEAGGVRVRLVDGELSARRVLLATPMDSAARLLANIVPDLAARLASTPMAEIETQAVVLPAAKLRLPPFAGLIGGDDSFYSAVSRDYLPHPTLRGFSFHFKPGLLDGEARRRRIAEVLGCQPGDFLHETEKINSLPALTPASVGLAAELHQRLASTPVRVAGNYLNGLSLGDAAQHAASAWT